MNPLSQSLRSHLLSTGEELQIVYHPWAKPEEAYGIRLVPVPGRHNGRTSNRDHFSFAWPTASPKWHSSPEAAEAFLEQNLEDYTQFATRQANILKIAGLCAQTPEWVSQVEELARIGTFSGGTSYQKTQTHEPLTQIMGQIGDWPKATPEQENLARRAALAIATRGHYAKHNSQVTLLLASAQQEDTARLGLDLDPPKSLASQVDPSMALMICNELDQRDWNFRTFLQHRLNDPSSRQGDVKAILSKGNDNVIRALDELLPSTDHKLPFAYQWALHHPRMQTEPWILDTAMSYIQDSDQPSVRQGILQDALAHCYRENFDGPIPMLLALGVKPKPVLRKLIASTTAAETLQRYTLLLSRLDKPERLRTTQPEQEMETDSGLDLV